MFVAPVSDLHALPQKTTIDLGGIIFPCTNCEAGSDGTYRLTVGSETVMLLPFEARRKLFEVTPTADLAKLNKTGEILRFLLTQDLKFEETKKILQALLETPGGRSTFILSFESIYQVHPRNVFELLVQTELPAEVVEGILRSPLAATDPILAMTLLGISGRGDLADIVEKSLDRDPEVTLQSVAELQKALEIPQLKPVAARLEGDLKEIQLAIEHTSESHASAYREAGLRPSVRRLMRKQRLLTLTGRAREVETVEESREVLKDLTTAYDPSLDTPSLQEAFRHLIDTVPDSLTIVAPIKDELASRDPTLQLMLNPPPPMEQSLAAIGGTVLVILLAVGGGAYVWRNRWREQQLIELREGLSLDERRELSLLLERFDLNGPVSLADLKQAFRARAKELHPDTGGPDQEGDEFIELQRSYARARELLGAFRT